ncbi:hypothetical protein GHT07_11030 [Caenimonas koreensis DSM 17982]|uniref:Uncharacterized protein n=1 Tax=Caenimonas koreensis DSM 17982 TaxID=1121255 RepID=A0A844B3L4_9BURK|nr:hypothetical protein [Caenimonas koreensis]MRD47813.1 hypothetical protein [Caenimonas koreensis DSM 17982]
MTTNDKQRGSQPSAASDFAGSLWKGALGGVLILAIAIPVMRWRQQSAAPATPAVVAIAPVAPVQPAPPAAGPSAAQPPLTFRVANFGDHEPSRDARNMADWILQSGDNQKRAFVIVDKKGAQVYVFDANGKLKQTTMALMGKAIGDDSFPGSI